MRYLSHKSTPSSPLRCATGSPSFPRGDGFGGIPRAEWGMPERVTKFADYKKLLLQDGASRTSPPTDGELTLSLSIAKMQLMQAACQKPAQIPLRHDTGDSPAVSCPADTTQGDSPAVSCPADTTQGDSPRYHGLRFCSARDDTGGDAK